MIFADQVSSVAMILRLFAAGSLSFACNKAFAIEKSATLRSQIFQYTDTKTKKAFYERKKTVKRLQGSPIYQIKTYNGI